ncbi:MAG: DUF4163 domain-containing protein [Alphaproteobacteria bacterium]|nr:DUF4163 domain-containing protein [Alphaproteobacteria bacterium]
MRSIVALALSLIIAGAALAAPPQKMTIKEARKGYEIDISYPRFGRPAIDRQLETWARGVAKAFAEVSRESTGEPNPWATEVSYEIKRNDAQMFVVSFQEYSYTGGAHPNTSSETFNFLMPDGRRVEIAELFSPKGIRRISDISIAQLKQDTGGSDGLADMDWVRRGAGPNARNFASFLLMPRTLHITFDAYQVAAYAAGPQEVNIPLSNLRDVLRPNPRALAPSFDCLAARSEVERAICSSSDLARLDRHMGEAYAGKLVWIDATAEQQAFRARQRAWLKRRDSSCRGPAIAACLTSIYQQRLKELEEPG